ncbi:MAG: restriction endonuclease subunit S [Treponema sp.]
MKKPKKNYWEERSRMSNIPKLRFPEFSGEWEENKLSDFMTRLTRKNSNNESSRALTISSVDGLIDQGEFFKKQIASKDTSGYYLLKKGDFAYNKSYSVGYDYGSIKRLDRYEDGVVSTLYICMSLTSDTNSDYLTHYFDSMKWNKSVSEISAEGARNHGLLNIPTEAFFQTKHYLAPSLPEQQKIADFLSNVDSIITAETKILNTLQKKKKALMQKLFTQQLRFKSDDGTDFPAWEEKKLGECVEILDSQRKPIESKERANRKGEYPYYGASGIIDYIDDYLFEGESILLGEDGANIINRNSRLAFIATGKYWVNNHAHIMKANADNLNYFICEYLESLDYSKICAGSAQPKLTQDVIRNLTIKAPCKAEQQKIADCLSSMDSLIQNQQKVVTAWQQRKKALLQQMFI